MPFFSARSLGLYVWWCIWRSHCSWLLWWNCVGIWSKAFAGECMFEIIYFLLLNVLKHKLAVFLCFAWYKSFECLLQRPLLSLDAHIRIVNRYNWFINLNSLRDALTLCDFTCPLMHVFSTESSSIDTVRLGQWCQQMFLHQKPALSNCLLFPAPWFRTFQPLSSFLYAVLCVGPIHRVSQGLFHFLWRRWWVERIKALWMHFARTEQH